MFYFLNLIFGCTYLSIIKINKWKDLYKILPVVLLWTLIAGGQINIGVDYPIYLSFFSKPIGWRIEYEFLFRKITTSLYTWGISGQLFFFVYAFVTAIVIFCGAYKAKIQNWGFFYLLLICVSTVFNAQMNALRQCIAVGFVFWGMMEIFESKLKAVFLIIIGGLFHTSAYICLAFIWWKPIIRFTQRNASLLLILAFISAFISDAAVELNNALLNLVPDSVMKHTHYDYYKDSSLGRSTPFIYRVSKIVFLPLYFKSLMLINKKILNPWENRLFQLGILSYFLRNLLIINQLLGRLSYYFWIPSVFPIYYLGCYYWKRREYARFGIVAAFSSAVYIFKVIVQAEGYEHKFIYFL